MGVDYSVQIDSAPRPTIQRARYARPQRAKRTISFLLFDHIGGLHTLFHTVSNLGCTIVPMV